MDTDLKKSSSFGCWSHCVIVNDVIKKQQQCIVCHVMSLLFIFLACYTLTVRQLLSRHVTNSLLKRHVNQNQTYNTIRISSAALQ